MTTIEKGEAMTAATRPLPDVERSVRRGAAYLDEHGPDQWRDQIDPDRLDIGDGCDCVLGQLYGDWDTALTELALVGWFRLGFHHSYNDREQLTEAWRQEITR